MSAAESDMQERKMSLKKISLLIIAGGKSSRMGRDKRWLNWQGRSFLENIVIKGLAAGFGEMIICAEKKSAELEELTDHYPVRLVFDELQETGPLEGIKQGLRSMENEYGWAVSCDMPFFDFSIEVKLLQALNSGEAELAAVVPVSEGRWQPLATIYGKKLLPYMEAAQSEGNGKLGYVIKKAKHIEVNCDDEKVSFFNINDSADYRLALGRAANSQRRMPIVSVSAPKSNTGKTTFIEKLIPLLREQGIKCGVVKRDCHGFDLDVEGKDSQRFTTAGAAAVAVVSPNSYFIMQQTEGRADLQDVIDKIGDTDFVFVESRSHGYLPTISLWRGMGEPLIDERTVALFTSTTQDINDIRQFELDDLKAAVEIIKFLIFFQKST